MTYLTIVIALALGYVIGLLQNGIKISTANSTVSKDKEGNPQYTEDLSHMLPPEMQQYLQQNQGFTKF